MSKSKPKKCLVAILKGGLGNQLFIYAASKAAALRTNRDLYLDTRIGYQKDRFGREYMLHQLGIRDPEVPPALSLSPHLSHWKHKWKRAWNKCLPESKRNYIADRSGEELLRLESHAKVIHVVGYWQREENFMDQSKPIRESIQIPPPGEKEIQEKGKALAETPSIFLHIRRDRFPKLLDFQYYQDAIDRIVQRLSNPTFLIFGDTIDTSLQQLDFHGYTVEVSPGTKSLSPLNDLWLMSRCPHGILSNSSFAWWGAWFGEPFHAQRNILAPANYGWPMSASKTWETIPNTILASDSMGP